MDMEQFNMITSSLLQSPRIARSFVFSSVRIGLSTVPIQRLPQWNRFDSRENVLKLVLREFEHIAVTINVIKRIYTIFYEF